MKPLVTAKPSARLADALRVTLAGLPADKASHRWFVALSGGADSTALLSSLNAIAPSYGAIVTALIVNHNLRQEAEKEAAQVAQFCAERAIKAEILTITDAAPRAARQEWARTKRYDLLCGFVRRHGGLLWLGHHRDDQTETIAMRLAKGSGLQGLQGMRSHSVIQGVLALRPFLDVPKQMLIAYCQAAKLAFIEDPSNHNVAYTRTKWRQHLQQSDEVGDNIGALLRSLGHVAARYNHLLDGALADFYSAHLRLANGGLSAILDKKAFMQQAPLAQIIILRRLLGHIGKSRYHVSFEAARRLAAELSAPFHQATLGHCVIRLQADEIHIMPEAGRGHAPIRLFAGDNILYQGRLIISSHIEGWLLPMNEARYASLAADNSYRLALASYEASLRGIFPYPVTLDERVITPHIIGVMHKDNAPQTDKASVQLEVMPFEV